MLATSEAQYSRWLHSQHGLEWDEQQQCYSPSPRVRTEEDDYYDAEFAERQAVSDLMNDFEW